MVLEFDDRAPKIRTVGGCRGSNAQRRRHERSFTPYFEHSSRAARRRQSAMAHASREGQDLRFVALALRRLAVGAARRCRDLADRLRLPRSPTRGCRPFWRSALAYAIAAYVILPRIVRMSLKLLKRGSVPSFTLTGDGFPGRSGQSRARRHVRRASRRLRPRRLDRGRSARPEKLVGHGRVLRAQSALSVGAVQHALSLRPQAGRRLPEGDRQEPAQAPPHPLLGAEPRPRRRSRTRRNSGSTPTVRRSTSASLWVGAGTRDTGLSFTDFTFQFTHATDADTNAERDFMLGELKAAGVIGEIDLASRRRADDPRQGQPLRRRRRDRGGVAGLRAAARSRSEQFAPSVTLHKYSRGALIMKIHGAQKAMLSPGAYPGQARGVNPNRGERSWMRRLS